MGKIIFVIGGVRSGKSRYALTLAKEMKAKTVFIATATALDREMEERIRSHKTSRPRGWGLIEEPLDPGRALVSVRPVYHTAIVDCLGLWITNLLMKEMGDEAIGKSIDKFVEAILKTKVDLVIVVSNEVGCGIVPGEHLSRRFRDLVGLANQMVAASADEVIVMQAGIPVKIK